MQTVKGLYDILPYGVDLPWKLSDYWLYVEEILRKTAKTFGFYEIRTPLLEKTELFQRGVGETSDIVTKEMYTFEDRAGRSLTLRPEGTASVMRSFIEHHLDQERKIHKFYYIGPMFRYERPQAGRYRQHVQFGVEALGNPSFEQDAEVIDLFLTAYRNLGLQNVELKINTVGDLETRQNYKDALEKFLRPNFEKLSSESQERLLKNPLRILDSKDTHDQTLLKEAPSILNYLSEASKEHFEGLKALLNKLKIPYIVDPNLVRGLDYYTHTVFEAVSRRAVAQNAIGGGGRYNDLLKALGGPDLPGIGFGIGIERVIQTLLEEKFSFPVLSKPFITLIPLGERAKEACILLSSELRHLFIPTEVDLTSKKIQKALQIADSTKTTYVLVLGDEELESGNIVLKHMKTRKEKTFSWKERLFAIETLWKEEEHV